MSGFRYKPASNESIKNVCEPILINVICNNCGAIIDQTSDQVFWWVETNHKKHCKKCLAK